MMNGLMLRIELKKGYNLKRVLELVDLMMECEDVVFVIGVENVNWKVIVLKTMMSELVSESMPDDVLTWGDSDDGKEKVG